MYKMVPKYFSKVAMYIHNVYVHVRNATANFGGFIFVLLLRKKSQYFSKKLFLKIIIMSPS